MYIVFLVLSKRNLSISNTLEAKSLPYLNYNRSNIKEIRFLVVESVITMLNNLPCVMRQYVLSSVGYFNGIHWTIELLFVLFWSSSLQEYAYIWWEHKYGQNMRDSLVVQAVTEGRIFYEHDHKHNAVKHGWIGRVKLMFGPAAYRPEIWAHPVNWPFFRVFMLPNRNRQVRISVPSKDKGLQM